MGNAFQKVNKSFAKYGLVARLYFTDRERVVTLSPKAQWNHHPAGILNFIERSHVYETRNRKTALWALWQQQWPADPAQTFGDFEPLNDDE